jgi:hypothetical protein
MTLVKIYNITGEYSTGQVLSDWQSWRFRRVRCGFVWIDFFVGLIVIFRLLVF